MAGAKSSSSSSSGGSAAEITFGPSYFMKSALSGGICCGITHGALCPVDVVKTRIQLDPQKYTKGMFNAFSTVIKTEGVSALATGFGPTAVGYFIQGFFKFGGVEVIKINTANYMGLEDAFKLRFPIYLAAAAGAEFVADVFLCPLEATRIRLVSDPKFASGLISAMPKIIKTDGFIRGFYSGFGPILFKQIPYTMAKFSVQGFSAEQIYKVTGTSPDTLSDRANIAVSLGSGVIAGVAAAIISHPADTLLSLVNREGAGGTGSISSRLLNLARETGFKKLCLNGLGPRCVMIGTLTAGQFAIFDYILQLTGASKFHFTDPADEVKLA